MFWEAIAHKRVCGNGSLGGGCRHPVSSVYLDEGLLRAVGQEGADEAARRGNVGRVPLPAPAIAPLSLPPQRSTNRINLPNEY